MDRYNSRLAKLVAKLAGWRQAGITLGQTTYYSVSSEVVDADHSWRSHENWHKVQWRRDGRLKFACLYLWYTLRHGYQNNPYEVEARGHE